MRCCICKKIIIKNTKYVELKGKKAFAHKNCVQEPLVNRNFYKQSIHYR